MRPSLITQTSCKDIRRQALKDSPLPTRLIPAFVWHLLCRKETAKTANTEELEVLSVLLLHHVMSDKPSNCSESVSSSEKRKSCLKAARNKHVRARSTSLAWSYSLSMQSHLTDCTTSGHEPLTLALQM